MDEQQLPKTEDLDYHKIAKLLEKYEEEFYKHGDKMAHPEDWWSDKIGKLIPKIRHRGHLELLQNND